MIEISHEDWISEACKRYQVPLKISFKCPVCGHSATVEEYSAAGAKDGQVGFVCIGRFNDKNTKSAFGGTYRDVPGGPCNYTGGGLIRLNPVRVIFKDGTHADYFDFTDSPLCEDEKYKSGSPDEHHCSSGDSRHLPRK